MNGHVLLLNADYSAMSVCSVERAVVLVLLQKADMLHSRDGRVIRSQRMRVPFPSVVRLRAYVRVPYRRIMLTRKNVLRRDGFRCQYCGGRDHLTIDHVHPRSRGGRDTWENLVTAQLESGRHGLGYTMIWEGLLAGLLLLLAFTNALAAWLTLASLIGYLAPEKAAA